MSCLINKAEVFGFLRQEYYEKQKYFFNINIAFKQWNDKITKRKTLLIITTIKQPDE